MRSERVRGEAAPVAVVTGAGRGIGRATARTFADAGWAVVVAELRPALGRRAEHELARLGARARFIATDVRQPSSVARMLGRALRSFGRIDCLVNNAGVLAPGPLGALSLGDLERMIAVNLRGPLLACRAVLPVMRRAGRGTIVNVASQLGKVGAAEYVVYCATKFGVVGFTEALAEETRGDGIRVWAVCPGLADTPMADRVVGKSRGARAGLLRPETVARAIVDLVRGRRRAPSGAAVDVIGRSG